MMQDEIVRQLPERTGRHLCVRCLVEVTGPDYFAFDHVCPACAEDGDYPLASTPGEETPGPNNGKESS